MNDPRFQSMHLAGLSRREEYRKARDVMQAQCGGNTILGMISPVGIVPPDGVTLTPEMAQIAKAEAIAQKIVCMLQDGKRTMRLVIGLNTIGRLPDNDIPIDDPAISRRHCAIVMHSDMSCELHDTASKNGTVLNGQLLKGPTKLRHGDVITISERTLIFYRTDESELAEMKATPLSDQTMPGR